MNRITFLFGRKLIIQWAALPMFLRKIKLLEGDYIKLPFIVWVGKKTIVLEPYDSWEEIDEVL